jgi:eukaryotic-like serine/threonine-protein kinase
MRRALRYIALTLVLIAVALVSALTTMRFAIHGREVTVPNLVNLNVPDARKQCVSTGLVLQIETKFYSNEIAPGRILSQSPPAGQLVRRGWRLRVAESLGAQRAVIPDVVGQSQRAAELNLRQRGLEMGTIATVNLGNQLPSQVLAQSPPANADGVTSPKVSLLLSSNTAIQVYVMPDLAGLSVDAAIKRITDAGMRVGAMLNINEAQGQPALNTPAVVVRTNPPPGQRITTGTPINLEVSR